MHVIYVDLGGIMKKIIFSFGLILALGIGISLYASREKHITVDQEIAIYSLLNRYVEALCNNPHELGQILNDSIIPQSLIQKATGYLEDLNRTHGECFGQSKAKIQEEILNGIEHLPEVLFELKMATEFTVKDFLDCLINVDNSSYDLKESTSGAFRCVERHLDVRGFIHLIFIEMQQGHGIGGGTAPNYPDKYPHYPNYPIPVDVEPRPLPEPPISLDWAECIDTCYASCGNIPE